MSPGRRRDVLQVLRSSGSALSISAIADALDTHPNTVRFHLAALVEEGRVQRYVSHTSGPGRPPLLFRAYAGMDPAGERRYRVLAQLLIGALEGQSDTRTTSIRAGRKWGAGAVSATAEPEGDDVDQLVVLLEELGFAPERTDTATAAQIGLRSCPFLELIDQHAQVICPAHLGLMQGALSALGSAVIVDSLEPFVEPDRCVAHLRSVGLAGR